MFTGSRASLFSAAVVLAATCVASNAAAYQLKHTSEGALVRWSRPEIVLTFSPTNDFQRDGLTERALRNAAETWNAEHPIAFTVEVGESNLGRAFDKRGENTNVVYWVTDNWTGQEDMLALTFLTYTPSDGEVLDADLAINGALFQWTDRSGEDHIDGFDLENALVHELGHVLGLDHSDREGATMFAMTRKNDMTKRDLDEDDRAAIAELYAEVPEATAEITDMSGCNTSNGTPSVLLLFGLAALFVRRYTGWTKRFANVTHREDAPRS